jgi:holo-[acyl-carrier protein] synthase
MQAELVHHSIFRDTASAPCLSDAQMPPRIPLSLPYTIGTDIVHINRIRELISGRAQSNDSGKRLTRFLNRILHPLERQDFDKRFPALSKLLGSQYPQDSGHDPTTQFPESTGSWLAGRWAAKEAAKKAWGAQTLGFKDVRVEVCDSGKVQVVCRGWRTTTMGQPPEVAEQVGRLSISHDGEYAVATVMATPLQIAPTDSQDAVGQ